MGRIPVAVLGATGSVGHRLITLLAEHPWFQVVALAASDYSVGKKYGEVVRWQLPVEIPEFARELTVLPCDPAQVQAPLVFSALPTEVAGDLEIAFARAGSFVSSNASPHRMDEDVPLVIPEVNAEHLDMMSRQQSERGWKGFIICNGNCSTIHLVLALKPLHQRFGLKRVAVTTMQAVSGAGYPGVASMDILDNVVPFIGSEEEKMEAETLKLLGSLKGQMVTPLPAKITAHCNRVPVVDGHTNACRSSWGRNWAGPRRAKIFWRCGRSSGR